MARVLNIHSIYSVKLIPVSSRLSFHLRFIYCQVQMTLSFKCTLEFAIARRTDCFIPRELMITRVVKLQKLNETWSWSVQRLKVEKKYRYAAETIKKGGSRLISARDVQMLISQSPRTPNALRRKFSSKLPDARELHF